MTAAQYSAIIVCAENNGYTDRGVGLHVIEQHSKRSCQLHVVHDLLGTNLLVVFILREDGQEVLGDVGNLMILRGQHAVALGIFLEYELFISGELRQIFPALIAAAGLQGDEGVELQGLFRDEHSDVPFAVVGHLACSVEVSHFLLCLVTTAGLA